MAKRKKGMTFIPYDYEAAYNKSLEDMNEFFVEQMFKHGKKVVYALKEIRAGDQFEVEIYPQFKKMDEVPPEGRSIKKDNDKAQRNLNDKNARKYVERLINENFTDTVSGLFTDNKLKNGHGTLALDNTCMVATKELFQEALPMIDCFDYSWSIVSDPQKAEQIENNLSAIISSNPDLELDTIGIHKDYEEMENRVVFGGFQALSWLVFLFGVVNLINTTLSNQMSRKRENSVFRAIGLTRKQLCQMTIYEGICYAFSAALATLAVGLPIAVLAARKFSEMTFDGVIMPYSFPFLQMGLFVLVLFGLEVILSFWTMRRQKNQSLVEEMRAME